MSVLGKHCNMGEDWKGKLYCGIHLKWNCREGYVDISMPNYVKKNWPNTSTSPPIASNTTHMNQIQSYMANIWTASCMKSSHHSMTNTKGNMYSKCWVVFCTTRVQLTWPSCVPSLLLHQNRPTLWSVRSNEYSKYYILCTLIQRQSFVSVHQTWYWTYTPTLATGLQEKDKVLREGTFSYGAYHGMATQSNWTVTLALHVQYLNLSSLSSWGGTRCTLCKHERSTNDPPDPCQTWIPTTANSHTYRQHNGRGNC